MTAGCPYPLVLGHASGRVLLLRARSAPGAARVSVRALHAHAAPVVGLHLCARAGLLVTASSDGHIVLWDAYKYLLKLPLLLLIHVWQRNLQGRIYPRAKGANPWAPLIAKLNLKYLTIIESKWSIFMFLFHLLFYTT